MKIISLIRISAQIRFLLACFIEISFCNNLYAADHQASDKSATTSNVPICTDFLSKFNQKPINLEFIGCRKIVSHGLAALEGNYRVKGIDASEIEKYFIKTAHMPKLRYICCGWESLPKNVKAQQTHGLFKLETNDYQITMTSGETPIHQRSHWKDISYFNVTVITYLETP